MKCKLVVACGLVLFLSSISAFAEPGKVDRETFKDFKVSSEVMNMALSAKLSFKTGNTLQNGPQKEAYSLYLNALVASIEPDKSRVVDQFLTQLRYVIGAGHEPNAGGGLNGWTHCAVAQAFLLVKKTPEVWGKLSEDEKNRMDWIMKAMAVTGHLGFDDANDYKTSLHCDDNFNKKWNPNHRLYLFVVLSAAAYFGPEELNAIYTSFNYDEYMKKFNEYGFTNIKATWSCYDWKNIFEKGGKYISPKTKTEMGTGTGVRHPFVYENIPLVNIAEIYAAGAEYNYSEKVFDGIKGKSWTLNNGKSPFLGQMGMMKEFNSNDAAGKRSSLGYCEQNFCSYTVMLLTLKVLGYWTDSERCRKMEKLMYVGNEDFLYKTKMGFHSFSKGKGEDTPKFETVKWLAYPIVLELWNNYLKQSIKANMK